MKKFILLGAAAVLSAFTAFSQCDEGGSLFGDVIAPCDPVGPVSANIAGFEVWRGDLYEINDVQAGASYSVDICQLADGVGGFIPTGGGAAWSASLTVVAPSGAIVAFGLDAASICELSFVAVEAGTHQLFINEVGECPGVSQDIDNGVPRVNYISGGSCDPPVTACVAGVVDGAGVPASLCPGQEFLYTVNTLTIPTGGDLAVLFDPIAGGTGGTGAAFTLGITGLVPGTIDDTLNVFLDNLAIFADGVTFFPLEGLWTITTQITDGVGVCDESDAVVIDFLTSADPGCLPVTACEAGVLDQAGIDNDLCPEESTLYAITGATIPNSPADGTYILKFAPVLGSGGGGLAAGAAYNLAFTGIPAGTEALDFSVEIDAELLLATGVAQPIMTGEWTITGGISTDADPFDVAATFCDQVPSVTLNFLDENEPACGGVVPCEIPYPAVDNASLSAIQNPNGSITFSWAPINGQIGCQINARVGDVAAPLVQTSIIVPGAGASSFTASPFALAPYGFQNINFRVRCGCQQNPTTIAGPYSAFVTVLNIPPAGSAISVVSDQAVKTPFVKVEGQRLLPLVQTMDNWAPVYTNPTIMTGAVRKSATARTSFDVFPNPTAGSVNMNYSAAAEGMINVRVFDLVGKAVADYNFAVNEGENFLNLDLSSFEKGLYVVEVLEGQVSSTAKVVLK